MRDTKKWPQGQRTNGQSPHPPHATTETVGDWGFKINKEENQTSFSALTGKEYLTITSPSESSIQALRERIGDLEDAFRSATGYGLDSLTQSEARYRANFKPLDKLRSRILEEGRKGGSGRGAEIRQDSVSGEVSFSIAPENTIKRFYVLPPVVSDGEVIPFRKMDGTK